jgi:hypothetical protein
VEFGAAGFDRLPNARDPEGDQIVHDDDIAWAECGDQRLLDPG